MKRSNIIGIIAAAVVIIVSVVLISWYLRKTTPMLIQGTVECTTYKASSKVPGRIDDMKIAQGDRVEKGQLLYTLSTPELEAKLQQAEAVKSAASALDQAALAGARIQQIEAALNMWEKAQAGLELARKTYERVKNLYEQGVVPEQKMDEASANYKAMEATALAMLMWRFFSSASKSVTVLPSATLPARSVAPAKCSIASSRVVLPLEA